MHSRTTFKKPEKEEGRSCFGHLASKSVQEAGCCFWQRVSIHSHSAPTRPDTRERKPKRETEREQENVRKATRQQYPTLSREAFPSAFHTKNRSVRSHDDGTRVVTRTLCRSFVCETETFERSLASFDARNEQRVAQLLKEPHVGSYSPRYCMAPCLETFPPTLSTNGERKASYCTVHGTRWLSGDAHRACHSHTAKVEEMRLGQDACLSTEQERRDCYGWRFRGRCACAKYRPISLRAPISPS